MNFHEDKNGSMNDSAKLWMIVLAIASLTGFSIYGAVICEDHVYEEPLVDDDGNQAYFVKDGNITIVSEYDNGTCVVNEDYAFEGRLVKATKTVREPNGFRLVFVILILCLAVIGIVVLVCAIIETLNIMPCPKR